MYLASRFLVSPIDRSGPVGMNRITSGSLNQANASAASSLVNGSMQSRGVSILSRIDGSRGKSETAAATGALITGYPGKLLITAHAAALESANSLKARRPALMRRPFPIYQACALTT